MRPGAVGGKVGFVWVAVHDPRLLKLVDDLASYRLTCVLRILPLINIHRRLRHLVVDEDSSVTAKVIEMIQEGLERRGR